MNGLTPTTRFVIALAGVAIVALLAEKPLREWRQRLQSPWQSSLAYGLGAWILLTAAFWFMQQVSLPVAAVGAIPAALMAVAVDIYTRRILHRRLAQKAEERVQQRKNRPAQGGVKKKRKKKG